MCQGGTGRYHALPNHYVIHAAPEVDFKHILTHNSVFISKIDIILQSKNALTTFTFFVFSGNVCNRCPGALEQQT